ncbi:MAG: Mrp/NBP35 family ATP-binding protein [Pseudomonadota bacterium]
MTIDRAAILSALRSVSVPGRDVNLTDADIVRALTIDGTTVRFVIEVDPSEGAKLEPMRAEAEAVVRALPQVDNVSVILTAHGPAAAQPKTPPSLKVGRHAKPQAGPAAVPGVRNIILVGSGKGGVGKSTVAANLAIALSQEGKAIGLLDADIYGPSQPRMMGLSARPESPDGQTIVPLVGHGVTMMSIGLMVGEGEAIIWRGPMLMGALQQLLGQVAWGELDALIVDLPPGTGDVQLTLSQKYHLKGAIIVSTPQDVALLDARKALDMFNKTKTPVLGLVENMASYICPKCGHEEFIFGRGGMRKEAKNLGLPFLGEVPLELEIRLGGDAGRPVVVSQPKSREAEAFRKMARSLIDSGHL